MYLLPTKKPYTKVTSKVSKSNYILTFTYGEPEISLALHNQATELVEHMSVIEESRNLIKRGKVMSWQEFTKNETK